MLVDRFDFLKCLANGFNEAKRYGEALAFFREGNKQAVRTLTRGFRSWHMKGVSGAGRTRQNAEAVDKLERALTIARANQKRGHEA